MKRFFLLILIPFVSMSQSSMNMSLLGTYDFSSTEGNDIWGWVDASGNEFALVGLRNGFSVVDVTNPTNPSEAFFISDVNSTWRDVKTWSNYAYITTEANAGLLIVDLTDMTGNTYWHVSQFTNSTTGSSVTFTAAHNIYIDENGIAYIFGASGSGPQSDGAIFLDVAANPTNPEYLGEWDDQYIHDGMVRGDTMWAGCIYAGKVYAVDVSNKSNPITIGSHSTPNSFTHNAWISANGNYVFTTDEQSGAYITAYDVSNINNIQEVDRIQSNPGSNSIPHNTHVDGNFLITSYYRDGTVVHDITYPNNMIQVAYYDSYSGSGSGFDGCWGTYPYLPSGNIISSDINSGPGGNGRLLIYGRNFQQASFLSGTVTNGNSGFPVSNVTIQIASTNSITTTNLLGNYNAVTINAGLYQVSFSATGYIPVTLSTTLSSGVMTVLDAVLYPGIALLGCTDSTAINYNPNATIDDSSCVYPAGCTNPLAYNYNPSANTSIAFGGIPSNSVGTGSYYSGNRHLIFDAYVESNIVSALVYTQNSNTITFELRDNSSTVIDDTTITVVSGTQRLYFDFDVPVGNDYELGIAGENSGLYRNNGGVSYPYDIGGLINITGSNATPSYYYFYYDIEVEAVCTGIISPVYGCTDPTATNYNPLATVDDGSCIYCVYGCMDTTQFNYDPLATCDDGSCIPIIYGCTDSTALNYYSAANVDDGTCVYCVYGCTDSTAMNYNPLATCDDGSCIIGNTYGCTDPLALNYNAWATIDDGSCIYPCTAIITGLFMSDVIHDRATFNFDNMNTSICIVDQLRIKYSGDGGVTWSQKNMGAPTGYNSSGVCNSTQRTDKLALNLTPSTTYIWQMRVWYCSTGATSWVTGPNFTTADVCPNVINFAVSSASATQATFTWDTTAAYSFVRIKLRVDTTNASWLSAGGFGVNYPALSKQKSGLSPGATYRGQARTWCSPIGGAYRSLTWTPLIWWTQPASIKIEGENTAIANLEIYPNPSRDIFNITFTSNEKQDLEIRIINVIGEELINEDLQQFVGQYSKQIDLTTNAKGIYFLEIETDDGVINKKLILQ